MGENEHKTVRKHKQNNLQEQQIREHFFWDILGTKQKTTTKRGILHFLASLYDLCCIILILMLLEKLIYRDVCDAKLRWDASIFPELQCQWFK